MPVRTGRRPKRVETHILYVRDGPAPPFPNTRVVVFLRERKQGAGHSLPTM